jgi:hypothetical protein
VTRGAGPLTAAALLTGLLVAGCGAKVDRKDLETKVADFVKRQTGTDITVHCPDGVKATKGVRVRCTTVLSGAPTDIDLLMVGNGHFRITATRVRNPGP